MGSANWAVNTGSVPSLPGNTKSKSDLRGEGEGGWVGEPVAQARTPTPQMPAVTRAQQQGGHPTQQGVQPPLYTGTHHSSASRFWMGDPLITMRCTVCICLAASVTSASGFLPGRRIAIGWWYCWHSSSSSSGGSSGGTSSDQHIAQGCCPLSPNKATTPT